VLSLKAPLKILNFALPFGLQVCLLLNLSLQLRDLGSQAN